MNGGILVALASSALVMNGILMAVAMRINHRPREMRMTVGLAAVDMFLCAMTVSTYIYHWSSGNPIDRVPLACHLKGVLDSVGVFASMMLVSLIAMFRASRVLGYEIPRWAGLGLGCYSFVYASVIVLGGIRHEFRITGSGIECVPDASTSFLSKLILILDGTSLLVFLGITVASYLQIFIATLASHGTELHLKYSWSNRLPILMRTSILMLSYTALVLPPGIFLLLEAFLPPDFNSAVSVPFDIFLTAIALLNPTLVLFAHSLIFQELSSSLRSIFS